MLSIRQSGFSLVEGMISMMLGVSCLAGFAAFVGQNVGFNSQLLLRSQVDEVVLEIFELIQQDLRRISSVRLTAANFNQHIANRDFLDAFKIGEFPGELANSCILFAYDINQNGRLDRTLPNELLGYRLKDGSIEARQKGAGCEQNGWQDLTDAQHVQITQLSFTLSPKMAQQWQVPQITMQLKGQAKRHQQINRLLSNRVDLVNAF